MKNSQIVAEIVKIIKSENNIIKRERKILLFFLDLFRELMSLALTEIDDHLVNELKSCGYSMKKESTLKNLFL